MNAPEPETTTFAALSEDVLRILFVQLCNVLGPRDAVAFSSASHALRALTQVLLQQLRANHEAAAALGLKVGMRSSRHAAVRVPMRSCKELREAKELAWGNRLSATDLTALGTLGEVLPALERLWLFGRSANPDGVQGLAAGLGAGALPAVTSLQIVGMAVCDAGAVALAAALDRGALPQLESLNLNSADIGDVGMVVLASALRRLPALKVLLLSGNSLGDDGFAALVAPKLPTGGLTKLKKLCIRYTKVADAGCAALAAALNNGALPALEKLVLVGISASAAAQAAVYEARANLQGEELESESESESESGAESEPVSESESESGSESGSESEEDEEGEDDT